MKGSRTSQLLNDHPIWVTGVGAVSVAGFSAAELWHAAAEGVCKRSWQKFAENHEYLTAQVPEMNHLASTIGQLRKLDRTAQFAGLAVQEAMNQAGLEKGTPQTGVTFGTSRGTFLKYLEAVNSVGGKRMSALLAAAGTASSISGSIAHQWKLEGPAVTISTACASAAHAIIAAAEKILLGEADIMVTGGTDACLHPAVLGPLSAASVLGSNEDESLFCRPFDKDRNGLIPGEGAGCLVLESAESAVKRGAQPLAVLRGWAARSDNGGRTGITEDGSSLLDSMNAAIQLAGISVDQVGYINAHGTGTRMNDLAEANAISVFQSNRSEPIPVSSTKPVTGHCLGATPALEASIAISALRSGVLPPTKGCISQDPKCKIDLITECHRSTTAEVAISNSLGFWGHIATLVIQGVP